VISCEVDNGVAHIALRTPPVNALKIGDLEALCDLCSALDSRPDVKSILVRGEGRGFSAGLDYKQMQEPGGPEWLREVGLACRRSLAALAGCNVPLVAAVHGFCMGIGVAIVATCDIVVASDDARFGLPDGSWSVAHLARLVPPPKLRLMTLTGLPVSAEELHQLGTLAQVVSTDELSGAAASIATALSLRPRAMLTSLKARLNVVDPLEMDSVFAREQQVLADMLLQDERI